MNASLNGVVYAIGWSLIDFVWQGAIIAGIAAMLLWALRGARPQVRYALACAALLLCAALPVMNTVSNLFGDATQTGIAYDFAADNAELIEQTAPNVQRWLQHHLTTIVGIWASCALLFLIRTSFGLLWVKRIRSAPRNASWQTQLTQLCDKLGVVRRVRLLVVEGLESPVTAGLWQPIVLVPASLISGMEPGLLTALLAHEVAHIRRYDYIFNLIQRFIESILFYHPAVWWLSARIRDEREMIADDLAAKALGEPRRLAFALQELDRIQYSATTIALAAHGGNLMSRIKRLVQPDTQTLGWKAAVPALVSIALISTCFAFGGQALASGGNGAVKNRSRPVFSDLNACKPNYPADSVSKGETGHVFIKLVVAANGSLKSSEVTKSSGYPALDQATLDGFRSCKFLPEIVKGVPREGTIEAEYVWKLDE